MYLPEAWSSKPIPDNELLVQLSGMVVPERVRAAERLPAGGELFVYQALI